MTTISKESYAEAEKVFKQEFWEDSKCLTSAAARNLENEIKELNAALENEYDATLKSDMPEDEKQVRLLVISNLKCQAKLTLELAQITKNQILSL